MPPAMPNELGDLLRRWRDRLDPHAVGLPSYGLRRAKGVRREELAALAGLSVDYITRLEQGRSVTPSAQVVLALARALQLDRAEADLLHRTAGLLPPAVDCLSRHVPPSIQRITFRLAELPLATFAGDWTLLQSSDPWQALFESMAGETNLVRAVFGATRPLPIAANEPFDAHFETALVADLRRAASLYPRDPQLGALVVELKAQSVRFAELWDSGVVAAHRSERKTISTVLVGDITLDCDVLTLPDSDVKLVIYTATPGSEDAEKLEFLRVSALRTFQAH